MAVKGYWQNYINGEWVDGGGGRLPVENPSTGEHLADVARADAGDVDRAVAVARACHESHVLTSDKPIVRGRMIRQMGEYLQDHEAEIVEILTLEAGKPLAESRIEVEGAARYLEFYGNIAESNGGREIPMGDQYYNFTVHEPYGVSAQIIPWNFPLDIIARGIGPALAAGNACVIKTPELTPLSCTFFADAAEAVGLPKGALNIVCGYGNEAGAALATHRDIDQMVFTGSVPTGTSIATAAAQNLVPCVLELGGKSAAIVYEDADIDNLVENVRWALFYHSGQICSAMSRVLVHESIHDDLLDAVRAKAESMSMGAGIDDHDMGAMTSFQQRDRAAELVTLAIADGARLVSGGATPDLPGAHYQPTLLADVAPDMMIAQTEVFGPVLSAIPFRHEEEAIRIANNSDYGLVGGVFTRDISRALKAAQSIRAGQIFINEWFIGGAETPFGGFKQSGYGREKGREALMNYVQTKSIGVKL